MDRTRFMYFRRLKWFFSKSGIIMLSLEHFLAMVPATILVPILVNNSIGFNVIDMALVLFTSGVGSLMFSLWSRIDFVEKKIRFEPGIPAYLGSSFAYIGLTIYLLEIQIGEGIAPGMAYIYVGYSYFFSGLVLLILSLLYKLKFIVSFFSYFLPASVIGPAISLIGLELADNAIADSGVETVVRVVDGEVMPVVAVDVKAVTVAVVTLFVIILLSLIKHRGFKNMAIILGMAVGYVVYLLLNGLPQVDVQSLHWWQAPNFQIPFLAGDSLLPPNWQRLFLSVIPATLVVFMVNIGRVTVIHRMQNENKNDDPLFDEDTVKIMERALRAHGIASMTASFCGSVPNTIYAENIAVMGLHNNADPVDEPDPVIRKLNDPLSLIPYWGAAFIAILVSFVGILQTLLLGIPKPVIGGMELFLFGVISAPGIQLLVDQRVNYKKISNQIITAGVLIAGISGVSLDFGWFELKGMSLGLVVGFALNALVLILKQLGLLCDPLSTDEVLSAVLDQIPENDQRIAIGMTSDILNANEISVRDMREVLAGRDGKCIVDGNSRKHNSFVREAVEKATTITIKTTKAAIRIRRTANRIILELREDMLPEDTIKMYRHDYRDAIDTEKITEVSPTGQNEEIPFLLLDLSRNLPMHGVQRLVKDMTLL